MIAANELISSVYQSEKPHVFCVNVIEHILYICICVNMLNCGLLHFMHLHVSNVSVGDQKMLRVNKSKMSNK